MTSLDPRINDLKGYDYSYDGLNRLVGAGYLNLTDTLDNGTFDVTHVSYDKNGNIAGLTRKGADMSYAGKDIDSLAYSYIGGGNRLLSVSDGWDASLGFVDGNTAGADYSYDANGNTVEDKNKGIAIKYNSLNLPEKISALDSASYYVKYFYGATGSKLRKEVYMGDTLASTTDYCGGTEFLDGALRYLYTEEGVVEDQSGAKTYGYFLKDHLGNTRAVVSRGSGNTVNVLQVKSYYPFGMAFPGGDLGSDNRYLYNGKELQDVSLGGVLLGLYDYGARFYDPPSGRFISMDPLAEMAYGWTPYRYGFDNPLSFTDPTGLYENMPNDYFDINTGQYLGTDKDEEHDDVRLISQSNWNNSAKENSVGAVEGSISLAETKDVSNSWIKKNVVFREIGNFYIHDAGYKLNELENSTITLNDDWYSAAKINDQDADGLLELNITPRKYGSILNNKYDFINLIIHERGYHGTRFLNGEIWEPATKEQEWESEAYRGQMNHPSWDKTSPAFREYILTESKKYLK